MANKYCIVKILQIRNKIIYLNRTFPFSFIISSYYIKNHFIIIDEIFSDAKKVALQKADQKFQ